MKTKLESGSIGNLALEYQEWMNKTLNGQLPKGQTFIEYGNDRQSKLREYINNSNFWKIRR